MVKSILLLLSVVLIASDAQLSTVSKRFRNKEQEQVEFGRNNVVRKSSRGEGQRKRMLQAKGHKEPKEEGEDIPGTPEDITPLSAAGSMSVSMSMGLDDFDFEVSMSMEDMSLPAEEDSMSLVVTEEVVEPVEEEVVEEEVVVELPVPEPEPEPIGCNGDEYCPADMKCQCWLFCRFCFFPPCGTCVAN
jgi:hypothetical protein